MRRLHLPFDDPGAEPSDAGSVLALTSPMGFEFALVSGGPQSIAGRLPDDQTSLWLGLLLDGKACLVHSDGETALTPDHLILGATGVDARLTFTAPWRQLFLRIPRVAIDARLLAPMEAIVTVVSPETVLEHGLLALLRSIAQSLATDRSGEWNAIESALTELLVAALASSAGTAGRGGAAAAKARQLDRICRRIETQLGDPELSVGSIARDEGVSTRYLQNLFARSDQTVTNYVKNRRLERARADLVSPLHAQLSISEIAFRWGFNQSAHFSRAFRARYEETPRDARMKALEPKQSGTYSDK
ncbi:helix-turn-helix domain-containing protein [Altericroceibacterium spongiae]|nr:helix-turn-helix domain-containing protein [Altericroceibacterium spongiae]